MTLSEVPPFDVYKTLRRQTSWGVPQDHEIKTALRKSLGGAYMHDKDIPVAMARIIGDGAISLHIVEVVVAIERRGRGIGQTLMRRLISDMKSSFPSSASVTLMAAYRQESFYNALGFISRPNSDFGAGMIARLSDL